MADATVTVVNNRPQVEVYGSSLLAPLVSSATAAKDAAEAAAEDAQAVADGVAMTVTPFSEVPSAGSNALALISVKIFTKDADGVVVTIPDEVELRELQIYNTNLFRIRLGEIGGAQFAREAGSGTAATLSATTGFLEVSLIEDSGSTGSNTREIGKALINLDAITPANFDGTNLEVPLDARKLYQNSVEAANVETQIADAITEATAPQSPFLPSVNDPYMEELVEDLIVDFGLAGRSYVPNWRSDTVGDERRLQFTLRDPIRGEDIASWSDSKDYDWSDEVPESVHLSGAAAGSPNAGLEYVGTGCTLFLKPGAVDFTKGASSHTTVETGGINPNRVWSVEETKRRILEGRGVRNKVRTFGAGGDFETLKEAVDFLLKDSLIPEGGTKDDIQRAWWPFSDLCTPAHQWTLQALPGHTEVKTPAIPAGVDYARGILCWMGLTIRLLSDTEIKGETTGGVQTYVFDYNLGGRIIAEPGALVWTDGASTSAVHQDAQNVLSIPSEANASDPAAGLQHFRITGLIEGGTYRSVIFPWASGCSDGQYIRLKEPVFEVTDGSSANFLSHSSPDNLSPGFYDFDGVTLKGGSGSIALVTTDSVGARHGVRIANSAVNAVATSGTGEGWVRLGKQPGVTYDAGMEP
ncbi:MAG: hypothetical protein ACT6TH_15230 [Brevundimonas sp.]|uniref:hypothetical protein n=1 Tax=Brevundimonas sp. TaxID=1871086 RepID=UPI004034A6B9